MIRNIILAIFWQRHIQLVLVTTNLLNIDWTIATKASLPEFYEDLSRMSKTNCQSRLLFSQRSLEEIRPTSVPQGIAWPHPFVPSRLLRQGRFTKILELKVFSRKVSGVDIIEAWIASSPSRTWYKAHHSCPRNLPGIHWIDWLQPCQFYDEFAFSWLRFGIYVKSFQKMGFQNFDSGLFGMN